MQTQITSKTGSGSSSPLVINTNTTPVNVGFAVVVSGTVNYTVQHTYDNPNGTLTTWFDHPSVAAETTNQEGSYTTPVTAIRVTVNSGSGTATMSAVQAGIA